MKQRQQTLVEPVLHVASCYQILTFTGGTVGHVFCDCYDIMATGRQTMNSVWTNKVVFFQGHMCEY